MVRPAEVAEPAGGVLKAVEVDRVLGGFDGRLACQGGGGNVKEAQLGGVVEGKLGAPHRDAEPEAVALVHQQLIPRHQGEAAGK